MNTGRNDMRRGYQVRMTLLSQKLQLTGVDRRGVSTFVPLNVARKLSALRHRSVPHPKRELNPARRLSGNRLAEEGRAEVPDGRVVVDAVRHVERVHACRQRSFTARLPRGGDQREFVRPAQV